jgi:hypothetical protein
MLKKHPPKRLWDDCLELETFIRSNAWNEHPDLQGQTPESYISGQTADISAFCEPKWYEWVKFLEQITAFPDNKFVLSQYLGPSTDVGPVMTANMLTG